MHTFEIKPAHSKPHLFDLFVLKYHFPRCMRDGKCRRTHQQLAPVVQRTQFNFGLIQIFSFQQRHNVFHNAQQQGIPGIREDGPVEEELVVEQSRHRGVRVRVRRGEESLRDGVVRQREVRGVAPVVKVIRLFAQEEFVGGQHHVVELGADVSVVVHIHAYSHLKNMNIQGVKQTASQTEKYIKKDNISGTKLHKTPLQ